MTLRGWTLFLHFLVVGVVLLGLSPASAGKKPTSSRATVSATGASVQEIALAHQLIGFGKKTRSAEALLLAARILHRNPVQEEAANGGGKSPAPEKLTPAGLVTLAREFSDSDAIRTLAQEVEEKLKERSRGAVPSPRSFRGTLAPKALVTYQVTYKGGEQAVATVIGFSGADVDLFVYDAAGTLIASDRNTTSWGVCTWAVPNQATYRLVVENYDTKTPSGYQLVTN